MSSEDQKLIKKTKVEVDEADDGISLGALLQEKRKKLQNVGPKSISKPKKEEVQGEDGVGKSPNINCGSASKGTKVKKEERFNSVDDDFDEKPAKKSSAAKRDMELKKKKKVNEEKSKSAKGELESQKKEKKEKKVYDLPGQKRDPPEERDPLRIFYETLHKQVPHSEMAEFWMMESGLLSKEEAKKVFEKKQKKAPLQKLSSPGKTVTTVKSVTKTTIVKNTVQSPPVSSNKKTMTVGSKVVAKQSTKRNLKDESSEDESDDDFIISRSMKKKPRAA
ncbi:protein PXR1-like [Cucurbita moschata]|uniref:Protein PXR1-like n=1 Tax=Cucurbita moschata TaxID=3662 RepID=A0A6J1FIR2_CUCMO|nr:protein PXR1-like [Cucurbita moschata]